MSYAFDGVNDSINFGSDAAIDGFNQQSMAMWLTLDAINVVQTLLAKQANNAQWFWRSIASNNPRFNYDWTSTDLQNSAYGITFATGTLYHVVLTYDRTAVGNNAVMYLNGATFSVTRDSGPASGTSVSDAASNLRVGTDSGDNNDLNGKIGHLNYANAIWDAAQVNRARWWGTPGGGVQCYYPMYADAKNRGSVGSVADGTVTGAVINNAAIPRVERNWGAMMGVGR